MTSFDYLIILIYFVTVVAIGTLGFASQTNLKDYFLGERSIPWLASLGTLIASGISAITFIGIPALSYAKDLSELQLFIGMPLAAILAAWFIVPFFYRQDIITAYEYLGKRFDLKTRQFASTTTQILIALSLGLMLEAPSKVLSEITGLSYHWCVLLIALSTALYTIVGGLKAVIWTDLIQVLLVIIAPILTIILMAKRTEGGIGRLIQVASQNHKFHMFNTSLDPSNESTLWTGLIGLMIYNFSALVVNQSNTQKYLSAKSARGSQSAVVAHGFGLLIMWSIFFLVGVGLFSFHTIYPQRLPSGTDYDRVFVRFILNEMPTGIRGLVLTGVFASAMSAMSASLSALSSITVVDIWQRLFPSVNRENTVKGSRWITLGWCLIAIATALVLVRWGSMVKIGLRVGNFLSGPMLAIFLLGIFTRRANGSGAFAGGIVSLVVVTLVAQFTTISWAWYALIGTVVGMLSGYLLSLASPAPTREIVEKYTRLASASPATYKE